MILKLAFVFSSFVFAQGSKTDQRVNEHMQKMNKKIEIEAAKKEVELKKSAPKNFHADPAAKPKAPFRVYPTNNSVEPDPSVFPDQYDHSAGKDPSTEFEQNIQETRNEPTSEEENAAYIRQFKENAAKAGVKVNVDPKTLKARPVRNNSSN